MFKRLFEIFKAENHRSQFVLIILFSFIVQLIGNGFLGAIGYSILQFVFSWTIAIVFTQYANKKFGFEQIQWWKRWHLWMTISYLVIYMFFDEF